MCFALARDPRGSPAVSTYTLIPVVPPISSSFRSPAAHNKAHSASRCTEQCNREACTSRTVRNAVRGIGGAWQEISELCRSFALTTLSIDGRIRTCVAMKKAILTLRMIIMMCALLEAFIPDIPTSSPRVLLSLTDCASDLWTRSNKSDCRDCLFLIFYRYVVQLNSCRTTTSHGDPESAGIALPFKRSGLRGGARCM